MASQPLSVSDMQITVHDRDFDEHKDAWYPVYMVKGLATAAYFKPKHCPASTSLVHRKAVSSLEGTDHENSQANRCNEDGA